MLQIPTVTQDDLYAFHARVFGSTTATPLWTAPGEAAYDDQCLNYDGEQNDGDLGYYPDGVERTLTDEQVAMFRHSEIYAILRARQVRRENREADADDHSDDEADCVGRASQALVSSNEELRLQPDKDFDGTSHIPKHASQDSASAIYVERSTSSKRKRDDTEKASLYPEARKSRSTRRVVRELDGSVPEEQVLDYGDGPSVAVEDRALQSETPPEATRSNVAKATLEAPDASDGSFSGGKRIWWPTISI